MEDPLNRVVIIQKVVSFASRRLNDIVHLNFVNDAFSDTVKNYALHLFHALSTSSTTETFRKLFLRAVEVRSVWLVRVLAEFFSSRKGMLFSEAPGDLLGGQGGDTPLGYVARKMRSIMQMQGGKNKEELIARSLELVELLLSFSFPPNLYDHRGYTAWHYAVTSGNIELVKMFLDLERISNKTEKLRINSVTHKEETPLLLATKYGFVDIFELLMKQKGVDVEARDDGDSNLFHYLASSTSISELKDVQEEHILEKKMEILRKLLEEGNKQKKQIFKKLLTSYLESFNQDGKTPFHIAIRGLNFDFLKSFVEMVTKEQKEEEVAESPLLLTRCEIDNALFKVKSKEDKFDAENLTVFEKVFMSSPSVIEKFASLLLQVKQTKEEKDAVLKSIKIDEMVNLGMGVSAKFRQGDPEILRKDTEDIIKRLLDSSV